MELSGLVKPTKTRLAAFLVLLIIFELLVFYIGYSVMIQCTCPEPPEPCDCTLSASERIGFGTGALIGINTHIFIVPIFLFLYLLSCGLVGVIHRLRK